MSRDINDTPVKLAGMTLPVRLSELDGDENRALIDAEGTLIADLYANCVENYGVPQNYERSAECIARAINLYPRMVCMLRRALKLRSLECCLMDGSWKGNRRQVRREAREIEKAIHELLAEAKER